jgi:hypothetical protein
MTKKDRSPDKPQASPNPRPRRRNKKQRDTMPKLKKRDSPIGTPITTPINTPDRTPPAANSFSALQTDSDAEEEKSIETINAEEPQIELESENEEQPSTESPAEEIQPPQQTAELMSTPDDLKLSTSSTGPIAEILPTDLERLKESVPIFASDLAKSAGKLFPDAGEHRSPPADDLQSLSSRKKPPPAASLPIQKQTSLPPSTRPDLLVNSAYFLSRKLPSADTERKLAEDIFGDDAKPPAKQLPATQTVSTIHGTKTQADIITEYENTSLKKTI